MKKIIFLILVIISVQCSAKKESEIKPENINQTSRSYSDFTVKESQTIHRKFREGKWGASTHEWAHQGNDTRYIFLNYGEFFPTTILNCNPTKKKELIVEINTELERFITKSDLGNISLKNYIEKATVDGLLILHKGKIVFEDYPRMLPSDKHLYMSVSKTFVSTAIAILEDRDELDSEKAIDNYISELTGTEWEGIKIRNLLDMASGFEQDDFEDPNSMFKKILTAWGIFNFNQPVYDPLDFFKTLRLTGQQGDKFSYSDANPLLLTVLVERITNERFVKFIEREIWQKIGVENDALFQNGAYGRAATPLGMSSTLRDFARYGLAFTPSGRNINSAIISDEYLANIYPNFNPKLKTKSWFSEEQKYNSYQWDEIYEEGDFYKHGHAGQGLYISPSRDLVIAFFGTMGKDGIEHQLPFISRQIANSKLFN